jgi:hypothetical protein
MTKRDQLLLWLLHHLAKYDIISTPSKVTDYKEEK